MWPLGWIHANTSLWVHHHIAERLSGVDPGCWESHKPKLEFGLYHSLHVWLATSSLARLKLFPIVSEKDAINHHFKCQLSIIRQNSASFNHQWAVGLNLLVTSAILPLPHWKISRTWSTHAFRHCIPQIIYLKRISQFNNIVSSIIIVKIISMFCSSHMAQWKVLEVNPWLLWNP